MSPCASSLPATRTKSRILLRSAMASRSLWAICCGSHMLSAERFTRGLPRAFVNYGSLLADWRSVISEVTGKLDLEWPLSFQQVESEVDEFLSDRLRHQLSTDKRLESDPDLSRWVLGTYRELAAAASGESASMHRRLSLTYREFEQAQRLYGPELLRIRSDLASSGRELAIRTQQLDAMESSLAARNTELEDAHAGRAVVEDDLATARHHLEANSRQLALHQSSNTALEAELEQKNEKLAASRKTIHTLEVDLDERNCGESTPSCAHCPGGLLVLFVA